MGSRIGLWGEETDDRGNGRTGEEGNDISEIHEREIKNTRSF
jgi:hypothetical protein